MIMNCYIKIEVEVIGFLVLLKTYIFQNLIDIVKKCELSNFFYNSLLIRKISFLFSIIFCQDQNLKEAKPEEKDTNVLV